MRVFANDREIDRVQHEGLGRRGGQAYLFVEMAGPPADGEVEVRFSDFKVYALAP